MTAFSKVFREIGLADELGSGMRNTYKYTRMYFGQEPEFIEGDVFRTIVPLSEVATTTVGPASPTAETSDEVGGEVSGDVSGEVGGEVGDEDEIKLSSGKLQDLLGYCTTPRTRSEMQYFSGIKSDRYFREKILQPMIASGLVKRTIPDKPRSSKQKYVRA